MSTGITSLSKLTEVSTVYPFAGLEVPFAIATLGFLVLFLGWQFVMEARHHKAIIGSFTASPAE